jgi:site-specific recombinase XerD
MAGKVTVRRVKRRGEWRWCVDRVEQGRRVREFFRAAQEAEAHAVALRRQRSVAGDSWIRLSAAERAELIEVYAAARARNVSLREVWQEWCAQAPSRAKVTPTLAAAVKACLEAKRAAGRRERYLSALSAALGQFIRGREELALGSVTRLEIQAHVGAVASLHSRATRLNRLSTLFAWAVRAGHLDANPCDRIERVTPEQRPPLILTPEQAHHALQFTRDHWPRYLAWLALTLLAGVRPEEAERSEWSAIAPGHVVIAAQTSKVRWRRVVPLMPLAAEWLAEARKREAELPLPAISLKRFRRKLRDELKLPKWPADLLRHTAASYLLAEHQDAGKVASWLGNSAGVLLRHYRELVTREDAKRFWEGRRENAE